MRHVVHQEGVQAEFVDELPHLGQPALPFYGCEWIRAGCGTLENHITGVTVTFDLSKSVFEQN